MFNAVKEKIQNVRARLKPENKNKQSTDAAARSNDTARQRAALSSRTQQNLLETEDHFARLPIPPHNASTPNLLRGSISPASTAVQTPARDFSPAHTLTRPGAIYVYGAEVESHYHVGSSFMATTPWAPSDSELLTPPPAPRLQSQERCEAILHLPANPALLALPAPLAPLAPQAASTRVPVSAAMRRQLAHSGTFGPQLGGPSSQVVASPSMQSMASDATFTSFQVQTAQIVPAPTAAPAHHIYDWAQVAQQRTDNDTDSASIETQSSESSFGHDAKDFIP